MIKKNLLSKVLVTALLSTLLLSGCGATGEAVSTVNGNSVDKIKEESTVEMTVAEAVVETATEMVEEVVENNKELESLTESEETEQESIENLDENVDTEAGFGDVDFSVYKHPEDLGDGNVLMYGEVTRVDGSEIEVLTYGGPFILNVSESTEMLGEVVEGTFIKFTNDGVATMSLPGIIQNVSKIELTTEDDVKDTTTISEFVEESIEKATEMIEVISEESVSDVEVISEESVQ